MAIVLGSLGIGMLSDMATASAQDAALETMNAIRPTTSKTFLSVPIEPVRYIFKLIPPLSGMRHVSNSRRSGKSFMITKKFLKPRWERDLLLTPQANVAAEPESWH